MISTPDKPFGLDTVEQSGYACGVCPEERHQLTWAGLLSRRPEEEGGLLGGNVEGCKLTFHRCVQLAPNLVDERATTEQKVDGNALT